MAHPEKASRADVLRLFYYIMGEEQAGMHAEVRHVTADMVSQIVEAMTRSLALLGRLRVEREAEERGNRWMDGAPSK